MPLWMFLCCIRGHQIKIKDESTLAVLTGFYSGYYTLNRKAKKPETILKLMQDKQSSVSKHEVDMNAEIALYQEREAHFKHVLGGMNNGR